MAPWNASGVRVEGKDGGGAPGPYTLSCIGATRCISESEFIGILFEPSEDFKPGPPSLSHFLGHSPDLRCSKMPWLI